LGAPYQEKFIYYNLKKIPSAKLGLSVGGSFDFLTGKLKRAPKGFRRIGLEWLWRLIKQPSRWKRIYTAVIVFPWRFFVFFFILPWLYRPNIACLLFKKEQNVGGKMKYKILIVERVGERDHWQLPQGGTDKESLMAAGARELREELNTENFKPIKVYKRLAQFGLSSKNPRGYKGQKQSLFIAEFNGRDRDIKINFWEHAAWRWVEADKLVEAVHPVRREAAKIFLEKFWEMVNPVIAASDPLRHSSSEARPQSRREPHEHSL
jgi:8-oxo-dGTP pyrophosphatase MutT (NUDIX family)